MSPGKRTTMSQIKDTTSTTHDVTTSDARAAQEARAALARAQWRAFADELAAEPDREAAGERLYLVVTSTLDSFAAALRELTYLRLAESSLGKANAEALTKAIFGEAPQMSTDAAPETKGLG